MLRSGEEEVGGDVEGGGVAGGSPPIILSYMPFIVFSLKKLIFN